MTPLMAQEVLFLPSHGTVQYMLQDDVIKLGMK